MGNHHSWDAEGIKEPKPSPPAQPVGAMPPNFGLSAAEYADLCIKARDYLKEQRIFQDSIDMRVLVVRVMADLAASQTMVLKQQLAEAQGSSRHWMTVAREIGQYRDQLKADLAEVREELRRVSTVAPQGKASGVPCPKSQDGIRETK